MTFLAWKPGHMITFLVCFFVLYWDNRLMRLTIDNTRKREWWLWMIKILTTENNSLNKTTVSFFYYYYFPFVS